MSRACTRSAGGTRMSLGEGIEHTYDWFLANHAGRRVDGGWLATWWLMPLARRI